MLTSWIVAGVVASALTGAPAAESPAVAAPPEGSVVVEVVTANGSGCPNGTATAVVAPDNSSITINYDDYVAWTGPGAGATEFRKNCQINLVVAVPAGYTFAISAAEHQGFAHLQAGATGLQRTAYYFTGQTPTAAATHRLTGPFTGRYEADEVFGAPVAAPCGARRNLNINTEVRVSPDQTGTEVSLISQGTGNRARSTYQLTWSRCS